MAKSTVVTSTIDGSTRADSTLAEALAKRPDIAVGWADSIGALVLVVDVRGDVLYANYEAERSRAAGASSLIGVNIHGDLGQGHEVVFEREAITRAVTQQEPVHVDGTWLGPTPDGGRRLVRWFLTGIPAQHGRTNRVVAIGRELVSELPPMATMESSQAHLQAVLNTAVEGIITIDSKGIVQSYNDAAQHMFGWAPSRVIGRNVKMLMPAHYSTAHDGFISDCLNTGTARIIGLGREV